jgi:hypothetical protein
MCLTDGIRIPNKLEVPRIRIYNSIMLNQEDKQVIMADVEESMSTLYWTYRDDMSDEGGKEMEKVIAKTRDEIINILEKFPA